MDNFWVAAIWSLTPTVLVGGVFWFLMRAIIRSDLGTSLFLPLRRIVERED